MKIIENKLLPPKGYTAINLFGYIFVRKGTELAAVTLNHERIHTAQMKELGYIFFYIIYFLEWLYRLVFHTKTAYRGITFEQEAYNHESNLRYIYERKYYAMWRKRYRDK